jgi:hypothetical protein
MEFPELKFNRKELTGQVYKAELQGLKKVGKNIVKSAKRYVRKRERKLEKSIKVLGQPRQTVFGVWQLDIGSDQPHAFAQEYGRPDLNNYGFTPYIRPAFDKEAPDLTTAITESFNS